MTGKRKTINKCLCDANKKKPKNDKGSKREKEQKKRVPQTRTSVWLFEEDLRARLPVLFEGTK